MMKKEELELALDTRTKEAGGRHLILPTLVGALMGGIIGKATDPGNPDTLEGIDESRKHKSKLTLTGTMGGLSLGLFKHLTHKTPWQRLMRR